MENEAVLDRRLAYGVLRFILGLNIFLHGAVRLAALSAFASGVMRQFAETPLPGFAVMGFAYGLPFVEGLVGLLLALGWLTRPASELGSLVMAALVFGTALRGDWNVLAIQMLKTNANTRIRLEATIQIMWCFSAKFRLARWPINVSAT